MTSPLPEDPYIALGVAKDAQLPEIRSAHRKLVLKCHPDKVQDPALKAIKQDEFQKVQQAYELLSDDTRRTQYDESVKLMEMRNELRREMGKGPHGPPSGKTVFDYEIRTAEPRPSTFKSRPKEPTNVYSRPPPRSFEDDLPSRMYDEPARSTPRKAPSYEDRKRSSTKEEDRRKKSDDDRERERREKEAKRSAHSSAKKSRDKERKKGSEDKHHRTVYVEDDDSDEPAHRSPKLEKKSSRKSDEETRTRDEPVRTAEKLRDEHVLTERTRKLNKVHDYASQYIGSRQKVEPEPDYARKPIRRAETFQEPSYSSRYVVPPPPYVTVEGDDFPRRSSAHAMPRRASHDVPVRSREPTSSPRDRNVSGTFSPEPVIIDADPPPSMKPSLQSHSSAPPIIQEHSRKEPGRSKTMQAQYSRSPPTTPLLSRASTFQAGDKPSAKQKSRGSKLKTTVQYASDESESEGRTYPSPRSPSPPPRRREPEEVRYKIENGRRVPLTHHRSALREDNYDPRERSVSPRGGRRSSDRPPLERSSGSSSRTPSYIPQSSSPEPFIIPARPKLAHRESYGHSRSSSNAAPYFGEVRYAQNYGPEHVTYSPEHLYRRGSDPGHHRDYPYPPARPSREAAYA